MSHQLAMHLTILVPSLQTATRTMAPSTQAQTVVYSAPELLAALCNPALPAPGPGSPASRALKRTTESDVFAFGMLLYELFTG